MLQLIKERDNICNQFHMPAQSGNNDVLKKMRRGYTIEAYHELVEKIRNVLKGKGNIFGAAPDIGEFPVR